MYFHEGEENRIFFYYCRAPKEHSCEQGLNLQNIWSLKGLIIILAVVQQMPSQTAPRWIERRVRYLGWVGGGAKYT